MPNDSVEENGKLKLFVVGESSGNPDDWPELGRRAFVVAGSAEEALLLVDFSSEAAELAPLRPVILVIDERIGNQE